MQSLAPGQVFENRVGADPDPEPSRTIRRGQDPGFMFERLQKPFKHHIMLFDLKPWC